MPRSDKMDSLDDVVVWPMGLLFGFLGSYWSVLSFSGVGRVGALYIHSMLELLSSSLLTEVFVGPDRPTVNQGFIRATNK